MTVPSETGDLAKSLAILGHRCLEITVKNVTPYFDTQRNKLVILFCDDSWVGTFGSMHELPFSRNSCTLVFRWSDPCALAPKVALTRFKRHNQLD